MAINWKDWQSIEQKSYRQNRIAAFLSYISWHIMTFAQFTSMTRLTSLTFRTPTKLTNLSTLTTSTDQKYYQEAVWRKLCEGTNGLRQKVWTQTKILSPHIRYFVAILRFVVIYALFRRLLATFENNSVTCSAGTLQFNYRRLAGYLW